MKTTKRLEIRGRENNLPLLRFLAAVMVIVQHAPAIAQNRDTWLYEHTGGQLNYGNLAVSVFFVISGLLIARSVSRGPSFRTYLTGRLSRLIPPLACVTFAMAFLAGPLLTTLAPGAYLTHPGTWKYLLNSVLIPVHPLPGVFEGMPYETVNGSLWTLPVEFICYLLCFGLFRAGWMTEKRLKWVIPAAVLAYVAARLLIHQELVQKALKPTLMFFVGVCAYVYRDRIPLDGRLALAALGLGAILTAVGALEFGIFLVLPYLVLYLGFGCRRWGISALLDRADLSYGMYLTGFPIQQILCFLAGGSMSPWLNGLLAVPLSILFGAALHFGVERPMMRKKKG